MGEPSWRVRWVVFGFDLLLNFQFMFSHLVTFGCRFLDSVLLFDFVLDLFVDVFPCLLTAPPRTPSWTPLKIDPFCFDGITPDATFRWDWAQAPFWVSGDHPLFSEYCCACGVARIFLGIRLYLRRRCVSIFDFFFIFLNSACNPQCRLEFEDLERAVNRQPLFTARVTLRASPSRARTVALNTWKQTSTASILLLFHEMFTFAWNLDCFMKSQFFMKSQLFHDISIFHEVSTFPWNLDVFIKISPCS